MLETNRYSVINIRRYLNSGNPKLGESRLLQVLSGFSCPRNPDVERFLKKSSIEFTKKNQSVTYLVFDISSMVLAGYFTLALKPLTVRGETVSNTVKKKLLRVSFSQFDTRQTVSNTDESHELVQLLRLL